MHSIDGANRLTNENTPVSVRLKLQSASKGHDLGGVMRESKLLSGTQKRQQQEKNCACVKYVLCVCECLRGPRSNES